MGEAEKTTSDLEDFVALLQKIRGPVETAYFEEMNRIRQEADLLEHYRERLPLKND